MLILKNWIELINSLGYSMKIIEQEIEKNTLLSVSQLNQNILHPEDVIEGNYIEEVSLAAYIILLSREVKKDVFFSSLLEGESTKILNYATDSGFLIS